MKTFEIYLNDLKESSQEEFFRTFDIKKEDMNHETIPIATIDMETEDETIYKKLQDMSPFERWVWLATEKVTTDSVKDPYPINSKVIKQLKYKQIENFFCGIEPSEGWPHK